LIFKWLFQRAFIKANKQNIKELLEFLPERNGVFLDIGANFGIFSFWVAFKFRKHGGVIHLFEPQDELNWVYIFLTKIFKEVEFRVHNIALSDHEGELLLQRQKVGDGSATLEMDRQDPENLKSGKIVPIKTLDLFCDTQELSRIDAIKIDVEGHEFSLLKGAELTLITYKPTVLLELTPSSTLCELAIGFFQDMGYEGFVLLNGVKFPVSEINIVPHPKFGLMGHRDVLFIHKEA